MALRFIVLAVAILALAWMMRQGFKAKNEYLHKKNRQEMAKSAKIYEEVYELMKGKQGRAPKPGEMFGSTGEQGRSEWKM